MTTAHRPDFDLVICGATAPGIVAAVRAAREGLQVALVASGPKLGGSLLSLGAVEAHYRGNRAPLLQEFCDRVGAHYRNRYGADSEQYRACAGGRMVTFEPHVAGAVLEQMVAAEKNVGVWRGFAPELVDKVGAMVRAVLFRNEETGDTLRLAARAFIEAGYEGDLMALAGAHREHTLGLMWFLQNDPEMPSDLREQARPWGLARDEFPETDNFPPQLYVREARRLVGRAVFTEHDTLAPPPPAPAAARAGACGFDRHHRILSRFAGIVP